MIDVLFLSPVGILPEFWTAVERKLSDLRLNTAAVELDGLELETSKTIAMLERSAFAVGLCGSGKQLMRALGVGAFPGLGGGVVFSPNLVPFGSIDRNESAIGSQLQRVAELSERQPAVARRLLESRRALNRSPDEDWIPTALGSVSWLSDDMSPERLGHYLRTVSRYYLDDVEPLIASLTRPLTFVVSDRDRLSDVRALENIDPDHVRVLRVNGDHYLPCTNPSLAASIIRQALSESGERP